MEISERIFPVLSKWQRLVWSHELKDWMLFGGRRVTKSAITYLRGAGCALHGKTAVWFCANKELADENWQEICDFLAPLHPDRMNRHAEAEIWFDTSSGKGVFKRKSGFNKSAGRSGTSDLLLFDEAQLLTKALFNRAKPAVLTTRGYVCMTLTPPANPEEFVQSAWLKDIIDSADEHGVPADRRAQRWYVTKKPTEPQDVAFVFLMTDLGSKIVDPSVLQYYEESIHYSQTKGYSKKGRNKVWDDYVKLAIDSLDSDRFNMGDDDYNREYNLHWGLDASNLVYYAQDGVARNENFEYDPSSPVYWFVDRGEGKGYHVMLLCNHIKIGERKIINRYDPTGDLEVVPVYAFRIFNEISTKDVISEPEMLNKTLELSIAMGYRLPNLVIYDVRAPGYRGAILEIGLTPSARNVPIEDGIRKIKRLISRNLLQVHPRCKRLWQNIMFYARDDKGFPDNDNNNDGADALRYGVWIISALSGEINDTSADSKELINQIDGGSDAAIESAGGMLLYF